LTRSRLSITIPFVLAAGALLPACEQLPNVPPIASFIYTPVSPILAGQTAVTFNASTSLDGDGTVVSYVWNFGDGTPEESVGGPTTTHVFPDTSRRCVEVVYAVLLWVVDDQGQRSSTSREVQVTELPAPSAPECQR